jgi:L-aspartate oxidase
MGGVATDIQGKSSIAGLWVSGEASSTGLHGANRLASNGLLEALVYADTCAKGIAETVGSGKIPNPAVSFDTVTASAAAPDPAAVTKLRRTMSDYVGVIRDEAGLRQALRTLAELDAEFGGRSDSFDNMLAAATVIAAAAYLRRESRGGHYRTDFPDKNPDLGHRSEITLDEAVALRNSL